ncbi:MAG: hypothetical protein M1818_005956 [Claussenomyces sp. TS43310]|nr:MAG: hypothetical protein M1818_005956 [Claussenomyces sp. TS43310]
MQLVIPCMWKTSVLRALPGRCVHQAVYAEQLITSPVLRSSASDSTRKCSPRESQYLGLPARARHPTDSIIRTCFIEKLDEWLAGDLRASLSLLKRKAFILAESCVAACASQRPASTESATRPRLAQYLWNEREVEMPELLDMLDSVRDSMGQLVVENKLRPRNNTMVALGNKYQAYADHHLEFSPASTVM